MKILINDITFTVNEALHKPFWNYVNTGKWERDTFNIIDYFVPQKGTVIDIGCWLGPMSLYMAAKGAQVYALDPDPVAYKGFIENLRLNPNLSPNIRSFNIAITQKSQKVTLFARKEYGQSSTSLLNRTRDSINNISIEGYSLYDFIQSVNLNHVDFIKIDIEGEEFEILPSLLPVIEKLGYPTLHISFHYSQLNEYLYQKKIGIKFFSLVLMKLENVLNFYLFKSKLLSTIKEAIEICKMYPFIYDESSNIIPLSALCADLLLKNNLNLLLSKTKWEK